MKNNYNYQSYYILIFLSLLYNAILYFITSDFQLCTFITSDYNLDLLLEVLSITIPCCIVVMKYVAYCVKMKSVSHTHYVFTTIDNIF